jgi:hypothetical protein
MLSDTLWSKGIKLMHGWVTFCLRVWVSDQCLGRVFVTNYLRWWYLNRTSPLSASVNDAFDSCHPTLNQCVRKTATNSTVNWLPFCNWLACHPTSYAVFSILCLSVLTRLFSFVKS